jgi:hypothetical protein
MYTIMRTARKMFTTLMLVSVAGYALAGCISPSTAIKPSGLEPNNNVVIKFHIQGNQVWVVDFWKEPGYSSNRGQIGNLQVIVYASNNTTVLEDFRIPDPRYGIPYEDFNNGVVESFEDDIDFYVLFPAWSNLGKVELFDKEGEFMTSVNIQEASFK